MKRSPRAAWRWVDELRAPTLSPAWLTKVLVWVLTGLLTVTGWVVVAEQVAHERAAAINAAKNQVSNRASTLEQFVVRTLEGADLLTLHVADKYLGAGPDALDLTGRNPEVIADPVISGRVFGPVSVVNAKGDLLATTVRGAARVLNVGRHPVFQEQLARRDDGLAISRPARSSFIPGTYIYLTRRVRNPDGSTRGFVGVQIRPEDLSNFGRSAALGAQDLISVIGLDGFTRAGREGDRLSSGEDLRGKLVMQRQDEDPNGIYVGPGSLDGIVRYFSHRRLRDYPIFVTAGVAEAAVLSGARVRANIYMASMAALTLISLLTAYLINASISQRQRRAAALAIANDRLRQAQRIAKIGDWELDLQNGQLLWSDQLCEMYENEAFGDRLPFEDFLSYLDDKGRETVRAALDLGVRTGETQSYRFSAHLPSGTVAERFAIAVPLRGPDGQVIGFRGTDQDVTSEATLRSLQEQVAYLARIDAMNTMAATLAHELNQPLTAASNYLAGGERLLTKGEAGRQACLEAVAAAKRQVLSAGEIIKRVRDMLGSGRQAESSSSIEAVATEAIQLLASTTALRLSAILIDVQPGADDVWIDRVQLQQVLVNIVRNAWEAAAEGPCPHVVVSARRSETGEHVLISIADNGPGIAQPFEALFSPFESSKAGGLGLGLSICRTIVEYHGGKIWVADTGPQGTTISLILPCSAGACRAEASRAMAPTRSGDSEPRLA